MKLLVLAQGYPSQADPIAGVFHRSQMAALAESGLDITIVTPLPYVPKWVAARNPRWARYRAPVEHETDGTIKIIRPRYLATPDENRLGFPHLTQGWAVNTLGLERPDVIQAFFALPTGWVARRVARRWNIPYVVSLLGDDVTRYPNFSMGIAARFAQVVTDANAVVANGEALSIRTEELTGRRPETLSIGIDFRRFSSLPSRSEARRSLGLPEDDILLLYAGNLLIQKGVADLDQAIGKVRLASVRCLVVGRGPEEARLRENPRMICVGAQPSDRIPLYMSAADYLVLPSWYEGLPTVVVEAGAAGLPVIGSLIPGITDLIGDDCGFSFPVRDVDALSATIESVIEDRPEALRRAERLRDRVHQRHDVRRNSDRLIEIYRQLVGS